MIYSKNEQLMRDESSKALINRNELEYNQYKLMKMRNKELAELRKRLSSVEERLNLIYEKLSIGQE